MMMVPHLLGLLGMLVLLIVDIQSATLPKSSELLLPPNDHGIEYLRSGEKRAGSKGNLAPATTTTAPNKRLVVGDWVAQWDEIYSAWFFYNVETRQSTWEKPQEMDHISFKQPGGEDSSSNDIDEHFYDIPPNNIELTPTKAATKAPARVAKYQYQPPLGARNTQARTAQPAAGAGAGAGPYKRIFVESDKGEYFGLNTTIFKTDGLLGGMYKKLVNYYDDTAKDYLSGVYSDALDDYLGGLIQFVGWFLFGSLMVLTNGLMLVYNDATDKRSFSSPSLTDWILPLSDSADGFSSRFLDNLTGIHWKFPVDNSFSDCYKDRKSCLEGDFPAEVGHLVDNIAGTKKLFSDWFQFSETIGDIMDNGGLE